MLAVVAALVAAAPAAAQDPATELCDRAGVEQFSDVAEGDYGAAYILCARALGLTKGTAAGGFEPDAKLSRAQMAAFLARLWRDTLGRACPTEPAHTFTDTASSFAEDDIACIYALGITKGTTASTFSPTGELDTAAVTRFTARLLNKAAPGTCDLTGDELAAAAGCLTGLNIAPDTTEAAAYDPTPRAQMAVYLIGAWHHATGRGQPPEPPTKPAKSPPLKDTAKYAAISADGEHLCAITTAGDAVCWGYNDHGQVDAPAGKYAAISAGWGHSCAITTAGDAVCWGDNWAGQVDAPAGKYAAISAGGSHSCAITTAGDAVCWGPVPAPDGVTLV